MIGDQSKHSKAIELCEKYQIDFIVGYEKLPDINKFKVFENSSRFVGAIICDEPTLSQFEKVADNIKPFENKYNEKLFLLIYYRHIQNLLWMVNFQIILKIFAIIFRLLSVAQ